MLPIINGVVLDNNRRPVSKVKISLKGKVAAESGADGSFSVPLAKLVKAESRVALTFAAEGYVSNTKMYDPKVAGINIVVIWPVAHSVKFDPSRDFDIELGSSRIQIPANVLAGSDGKKFSGPAALRYTWFDVTSPLQRAAAPGNFSGQMLDRSVRRLNSYGIFDFAVNDLKGRLLSLVRGAKIDLSIPVPRTLAPKAPKQVGYFDFDTVTGLWMQVGTFQFAPNTMSYNGSVTSFGGAHNLDDPQDTTCVTIQVVMQWNSAPLPNMSVTAHGPQYDSTGTTNAFGQVCLLVQRNASFTVDAFGGNYTTPLPLPIFTSPNFSSAASDCGDSVKCPLLGTVYADIATGGVGLWRNDPLVRDGFGV